MDSLKEKRSCVLIPSYISTARKQRWNIWDALAEAIRGCPRLLTVHQETVLQAIAV